MGNRYPDNLTALYRSQFRRLYVLAYRLVKQRERAEDLVQDVFCLALCRQEELVRHPNPTVCTLKNLAANELRLAENRLTLPMEEALLAAAEDGQTLEELLPVRLSAQDRQALLWRMEDQLSYTEMARRLGISETGCRSRVARAVARCRLLLKDE